MIRPRAALRSENLALGSVSSPPKLSPQPFKESGSLCILDLGACLGFPPTDSLYQVLFDIFMNYCNVLN